MVHSHIEESDENQTMLIGEFARAVGSTKDTVRFYTRLGLLTAGERSAGRRVYAVYDEMQVERFTFIEQCKALGSTLQEIGSGLQERDEGSLLCTCGPSLTPTQERVAEATGSVWA